MKLNINIQQGIKSEVELSAKINKVISEHFKSDTQINNSSKSGEPVWIVREN